MLSSIWPQMYMSSPHDIRHDENGPGVLHDAGPSYPTVELNHSVLPSALVEFGLQRPRTNSLALGECSQRKWQCEDGGRENKP
jgi:hypothetical protein